MTFVMCVACAGRLFGMEFMRWVLLARGGGLVERSVMSFSAPVVLSHARIFFL